jgi:hypothetical protein
MELFYTWLSIFSIKNQCQSNKIQREIEDSCNCEQCQPNKGELSPCIGFEVPQIQEELYEEEEDEGNDKRRIK